MTNIAHNRMTTANIKLAIPTVKRNIQGSNWNFPNEWYRLDIDFHMTVDFFISALPKCDLETNHFIQIGFSTELGKVYVFPLRLCEGTQA